MWTQVDGWPFGLRRQIRRQQEGPVDREDRVLWKSLIAVEVAHQDVSHRNFENVEATTFEQFCFEVSARRPPKRIGIAMEDHVRVVAIDRELAHWVDPQVLFEGLAGLVEKSEASLSRHVSLGEGETIN